jgi:hypothetical protein
MTTRFIAPWGFRFLQDHVGPWDDDHHDLAKEHSRAINSLNEVTIACYIQFDNYRHMTHTLMILYNAIFPLTTALNSLYVLMDGLGVAYDEDMLTRDSAIIRSRMDVIARECARRDRHLPMANAISRPAS